MSDTPRYRLKQDSHNGLLHVKASQPLPRYWRYFPSPDLAAFVEHYWTIEWNLPQPELRETLPYPSAHFVFEPGLADLAGVTTRKYSRWLEGDSRVLGVKFRPGGLRPFVPQRVSAYTDRVLPLAELYGAAGVRLGREALAHADHHACIATIEAFLRSRAPHSDATLALASTIATRIATDRSVRSVDELARAFGLTLRRLQRLFGEYVGVSPKWTIRRYRLQEAAERLAAAQTVDWPALALDLGYADQAHFIRDFKRLVGRAPAEYFKALAS